MQPAAQSAVRLAVAAGRRALHVHRPLSARLDRDRSVRARRAADRAPGLAGGAARVPRLVAAVRRVRVDRAECRHRGASRLADVHLQERHRQPQDGRRGRRDDVAVCGGRGQGRGDQAADCRHGVHVLRGVPADAGGADHATAPVRSGGQWRAAVAGLEGEWQADRAQCGRGVEE